MFGAKMKGTIETQEFLLLFCTIIAEKSPESIKKLIIS